MSEERALKVAASDERLHEVLELVNVMLEEHDCPPKAQMIEVSLEELFINIAHYAYPNGDGWTEILASDHRGEEEDHPPRTADA